VSGGHLGKKVFGGDAADGLILDGVKGRGIGGVKVVHYCVPQRPSHPYFREAVGF